MRKEIIYKLPYRIEGEEKEIELKISFISYRIMNNYAEAQFIASQALTANNRMAVLFELKAIEKDEKKEGWEKRILDYDKEYAECVDKIIEFNDNGFFRLRFEILQRILIDNGYKDNELLMSSDFWNDNVDPFHFSKFLEAAVYKDVDKKKALIV